MPAASYERQLWQLHKLILAGKGDSETAEDLCGQMDKSWYAMGPREQYRMRHIAAFLSIVRRGYAMPEDNIGVGALEPEQVRVLHQAFLEIRKRAKGSVTLGGLKIIRDTAVRAILAIDVLAAEEE